MNEKISALLDNELGRTDSLDVLDAIKKDPLGQLPWQRYHLYGAAIREELPSPISYDFHEKVASELKNEPVQLTPAAMQNDRSWQKPAFGLAIAASLLAIVVMVQKPFVADTTPVSVATTTTAPVLQADNQLIVANRNNENVKERINRLLVQHNEYNPASDMTGMMPYARFVSFSTSPGATK